MAGKRVATTELTHDNWDNEEEPEERGTFPTASEKELENRVIKKARRSVAATSSETDAAPKSAFSGFSGFGAKATPAPGGSKTATTPSTPFSFLSKIPAASTSSKATFSSGGADSGTADKPAVKINGDGKVVEGEIATTSNSEYHTKLKALNLSVSRWIQAHLDKNPVCILTPIFRDYEIHLKSFESKNTSAPAAVLSPFLKASTETTKTTVVESPMSSFKFTSSSPPTKTTESLFSLGAIPGTSGQPRPSIFGGNATVTQPDNSGEKPKANGFSFGLKPDANEAASSSFTFGKPEDTKPSTSAGFSFNTGATPFTFKNIQPPAADDATSKTSVDEDDEDHPPKVEFKQVLEDDAVYSKKCKVFVKKENNFADRGVGTLYLKPVKDTGKTQLLVRADTNLGNILVNVLLNAALPTKRMGKNNVMLMCLPTPDDEKPTTVLFRVKTDEEADALLETIENYKK